MKRPCPGHEPIEYKDYQPGELIAVWAHCCRCDKRPVMRGIDRFNVNGVKSISFWPYCADHDPRNHA